MSIIADTREPDNPFDEEELTCGDYIITGPEDGVIVERKEWTDLVQSYRSGKLYQQLRMCKEQDDYRVILLIEGSRGNAVRYANSSHHEMRRFLTSFVSNESDIQILISQSYQETIKIIQDLDEWIGDDRERVHSVREDTAKVPDTHRPRFIIEGFEGIGPKTAKRILDHFGTVEDVFTASETELQEVSGIGPKTAERMRESITREL